MSGKDKTLTHIDAKGEARMVDVSDKAAPARTATAEGFVSMAPETLALLRSGAAPKGDVLATARIAGIMAAKRCGELIPLAHPLPVESVSIDFDIPELEPDDNATAQLRIKATARISAKTGVEMEALTAVSVAALTVYDMCKAIDKTMVIHGVRLIEKTGGTKGVST